MSPSASSGHPRPYVLIANLESNRVALFQEALARCGRPPATVIAYANLLAERIELSKVVSRGAIVRIDSPGRNWEVEKALLAEGAKEADEPECDSLSLAEVTALEFDKGRLLYPRQWYQGYCRTLRRIACQLDACPPHHLLNALDEIALMFDKAATHACLLAAGLPVPRSFGSPVSYNDLLSRMETARCSRVFVKLAHGSSAAGTVAYRMGGDRHQAVTTVEMVCVEGELRLYNSRRVRTLTDRKEIAALLDTLCRHRVHVEEWLPKAGFQERAFDLRVMVIAGRARHVVARLSRSPMTNLHLLNKRGDVEALRERMGEAHWQAAMQACEQAMRCFPHSLYAGIDLLIAPGWKRQAILEVNAFGDLLPGILHEGQDTYEAEICAV